MTPDQYRRLLVSLRKRQLSANAKSVQRMEKVFEASIRRMARTLMDADLESLRAEFLSTLLADLDAELTNLRSDFAATLRTAMLEMAQVAASAQRAVEEKSGQPEDVRLTEEMTTSALLSNGSTIKVGFGSVALSAVQATAARVYSDGWTLSDRLYNLDKATRAAVQDAIVSGLAEQLSARNLAKRLLDNLTATGADNPRYQAMRIARTEINTSHREAHIRSTINPDTGTLKEFIQGIGWRLSLSHPAPDICDLYAADDGDGLGPGNYYPLNVPVSHPHCLCSTVTVLKDFPDVSAPRKEPEPHAVAEREILTLAEKYDDPVAKRWIANREESA